MIYAIMISECGVSMENMKLYKSKYSYINKFFLNNNIFFVQADIEEKVLYQVIKYHNKNYLCIILNNKVSSKRRFEIYKAIVFQQINSVNKKDDLNLNVLYINKRFVLKDDIYLSKKLDIKIKKVDNKTKVNFITYNYFKIKDLISRQGYNDFYEQYKKVGINETIEQVQKHVKHNIEDYFYIGTLKNMIRIYCKEIDSKIDYNNPPFGNKMLFKYLDNYFSKFAVITYDEIKVKKFIVKYYMTDIQAEDQVRSFIDNFLSLYKIITNINFSYQTKYQLDFKRLRLFNNRKASKYPFKNFYIHFDYVINNNENYYNLMFLLEFLELNKHNSSKKKYFSF